ncbi:MULTISPECIES: KpsF/GutQ family sugar-phosphate isomerase [Prosthecochloris]|uniref:KpsF/GutQ family sugar-phosphate isomerase n=1 Tax=Prosthecochloris vibrioformis TaxID=1098 RepID=A0A5C4RZD8_PROVB|nr:MULTISPECIES: KpsF/GutQ family sugar-phosphate isomerase [Prosthecochloris]TNJ36646.1 KpsF/GutQ family sugar-phosphate isomerase [Prosthecochloris vibrioformis]
MASPNPIESIIEQGRSILRMESRALENIATNLGAEFQSAVTLLKECKGKVIVSGMGKSGIIGQKIAATLSSTGTTALFMHPAEAAHGDLGVVEPGDVIIGLSKSGMTEELNFIIPPLRRIGVAIIAITGNKRSYLAEKSDVTLDIAVEQEACPFDLAPTTSTTAMLAMGDALGITLMRQKEFTHIDFALTHPKGSLGRRLTMKVADIMTSGEALPVTSETATGMDLVLEMSSKRFGVTAIVDTQGHLTGIFTDGDLRRLIQHKQDLSTISAKEVMSPSPKTVTPDTLAKECLDIMETHRITQLLVRSADNKPIGIIHIHDLVTLGL